MEIMQIVGYKNSGKTTTVNTLINVFTEKGIRVATLKHHGHGGIPIGFENTDSEKHRRAGAIISGVEGEGILQLSNSSAWDMEQMLAIYKFINVELLIVEGFKKENFQKIVLINKEEDLALLKQVTNIQAVITALPLKDNSHPYPVFRRGERDKFCEWILEKYNPYKQKEKQL